MNVIDEVEIDEFQVKEVLRCFLHTILFNRALGPVRPKEQDSDLFDITYVKCGETEVDKYVEEQLELFLLSLKPVALDLSRGQVMLSFYEKRIKKAAVFFMNNTEEKVYWEQWLFPILVNRRPRSVGSRGSPGALESARRQADTEESVRNTMLKIFDLLNKKRDHIPHVDMNVDHSMIFTFEITNSSS